MSNSVLLLSVLIFSKNWRVGGNDKQNRYSLFKQGLLLCIFAKSRSALKIPACIGDISLTIVWAIVTEIIKFIQTKKRERER